VDNGYDYSELDEFNRRIERAVEIVDDLFKEALGQMALDFLRKVKDRTPQRTGLLKDRWKIGEIVKKGDDYMIEVFDDTKYASFVEDGHRQKVGRYVPAIGKRLVKPWVEGRFMMKLTADEIEQEMPKYMERLEKKLAEELFKNLG
jgi:hypothetical protein